MARPKVYAARCCLHCAWMTSAEDPNLFPPKAPRCTLPGFQGRPGWRKVSQHEWCERFLWGLAPFYPIPPGDLAAMERMKLPGSEEADRG